MQLDGGNDFTQAPSLGVFSRGTKVIRDVLVAGEAEDWFKFKVGRLVRSGSLEYEISATSTATTSSLSFLPRYIYPKIKLFFQPKGKSNLRSLRTFTYAYPFDNFEGINTPTSSDYDSFYFRLNKPGTYYLKVAATPVDRRELTYSIKIAPSESDL